MRFKLIDMTLITFLQIMAFNFGLDSNDERE